MSFKSVRLHHLQTAFGLAHRLAHNEGVTPDVRKQARQIMKSIWDACGEDKDPPESLPAGFPGTGPAPRPAGSVEPDPQTDGGLPFGRADEARLQAIAEYEEGKIKGDA